MLSKGSRRRTRVCAYTVYSPGRVLIVKILAVVVGCPPVCVFVFFVLGVLRTGRGCKLQATQLSCPLSAKKRTYNKIFVCNAETLLFLLFGVFFESRTHR